MKANSCINKTLKAGYYVKVTSAPFMKIKATGCACNIEGLILKKISYNKRKQAIQNGEIVEL